MERKSISKKIRFEVFKRDSFTCQYCGKSAPGVLLEIDHIKPVSKNGDEDILNLVTACIDCNRGKSDRELSDDTVIQKKKAQLDELQTRREQIEMMMEWQNTLVDLSQVELDELVKFVNSFLPDHSLNDAGIQRMRRSLATFGLSEMLECTRISATQYLNLPTYQPEVEKYIEYIHRIARSRSNVSKKPYLAELYRLKNYMHSKGFYMGHDMMNILESAYLGGHSIDELERVIKNSSNWSDWRRNMQEAMNG